MEMKTRVTACDYALRLKAGKKARKFDGITNTDMFFNKAVAVDELITAHVLNKEIQ